VMPCLESAVPAAPFSSAAAADSADECIDFYGQPPADSNGCVVLGKLELDSSPAALITCILAAPRHYSLPRCRTSSGSRHNSDVDTLTASL
jgi:hypothetical protein